MIVGSVIAGTPPIAEAAAVSSVPQAAVLGTAEAEHDGAFPEAAIDDAGEGGYSYGYEEVVNAEGFVEGADGYFYHQQGATFDFPDEETFLTPQFWPAVAELGAENEAPAAEAVAAAAASGLQVEGRRLLWNVCAGTDDPVTTLLAIPKGECIESAAFWVAGAEVRLAFYPAGTSLTGDTDCSAELLCEDKAKLKFELFMNGRSGGRKVLLGKRFSCDFRRPAALAHDRDAQCTVVVGIEVHENLLYAGFF